MRTRRNPGLSPTDSPAATNDQYPPSAPVAAYVNDLISLCITTFIALRHDLVNLPYRMALGIARWWGGRVECTEEDGEEGIKLLEQPEQGGGKKKVKRRRRKEEAAGRNTAFTSVDGADHGGVEDPQYFPGMVNLSGVLCYMNSVLQVGYESTSKCKASKMITPVFGISHIARDPP